MEKQHTISGKEIEDQINKILTNSDTEKGFFNVNLWYIAHLLDDLQTDRILQNVLTRISNICANESERNPAKIIIQSKNEEDNATHSELETQPEKNEIILNKYLLSYRLDE